ncbi:phage-related protein [Terriglobus roseus DSM 18391]|uniref:Phage-related protein n=1 Tax=Terriglobus roseus (strain DSM 18391 / NRRL B-41598 / KBS 63) TaxID=926566 RepID=I3ZB68_TERRK|nr:phage portal protein [Terriglobus roseus]AFL86486.1 phage-related protein [Terriglobus roseus DSM 18391]
MGVVDRMRGALRGWKSDGLEAAVAEGVRKTAMLPSMLTPLARSAWRPAGNVHALPKATPQNLRRFAEMPMARRAINVVKDRISSMDWQVRAKRDVAVTEEVAARIRALRCALEQPNPQDSFRTLLEPVLEDILVGGFGAAEVEPTGDALQPVRLWPVDGATVAMDVAWNGDSDAPRYVQTALGAAAGVPLLDRELMYVRLNPRTHTPFGLGRLEVAFETLNQFLTANRYAGKLASNSVVQYALWLDEATPQQHERLIHWWQDEVEGTGQVPILSTAKKPEVLRFAGGTDADLRLQWQTFLLRIVANAFDLPPMLLGLEHDVNRSTASEMAEQAFQSAIVPVAKLLAEHITRDVIGKALGWDDVEFVFSDLLTRDSTEEADLQIKLLQAGVLTVAEVRAMRGLEASTVGPNGSGDGGMSAATGDGDSFRNNNENGEGSSSAATRNGSGVSGGEQSSESGAV